MSALGRIVLAASLATACQPAVNRSTVARVGNDSIGVEEFRARLAEYDLDHAPAPESRSETMDLRRRVLNELIEEKVLLAEARKRKLDASPEELERAMKEFEADYPGRSLDEILAEKKVSRSRLRERLRTKLLLKEVVQALTKDVTLPDAAEVAAYFKAHPTEFTSQERVHFRQIVVRTPEEAEKVLKELGSGTPFEDLAKRYSFTPEGAQGGDMGIVSPSIMPKELMEPLQKLPLRKVSPVVPSEYGFHIIEVLDRHPAKNKTLEEASEEITNTLVLKKKELQYATWRKETLSKASIERNNVLLETIH